MSRSVEHEAVERELALYREAMPETQESDRAAGDAQHRFY